MSKTYNWPVAQPPVAVQKPYDTGMHGDVRIDEYYWMADFFSEGPDREKVVEYLNEENAYTQKMMEGTSQFQADLFAEMKGRIKEKDESVPVFKNGYFYYLSDLIEKLLIETKWTIGRNAKQAIPSLKKMGDQSAHNRRYFAQFSDIEKIKDDLRIILDELVHLIDYPTWNKELGAMKK